MSSRNPHLARMYKRSGQSPSHPPLVMTETMKITGSQLVWPQLKPESAESARLVVVSYVNKSLLKLVY